MQYLNIFSTITKVDAKDCLVDKNNLLTFIVKENDLGRAVGKRGFKVKMLEKAVNRKIKILEFNPDLVTFVRNVIYPLQAKNIEVSEGIVTIEAADLKNRGLLIGRAAHNLRNFETVVKRHFEIKEIKVL
jgi:N utilization substance protein A